MKRAKIALSVIAIVGIVGGALAFKARNSQHLYFITAGTTDCTFERTAVSTIQLNPNQAPVTNIEVPLAESRGLCTTTTLYYTAP
jgi:hypothetical protein